MTKRTGQGELSIAPARRTRLLAAVAGTWLALLLLLAGWWSVLVFRQARLIANLEELAGQGSAAVLAEYARRRTMLEGESAFFLVLLLALTGALIWLYWRESLRTRGMQAFFAAVTHELRTPLTSIRLQAEAIADGDQRAELAQRLLEDSNRLESQIDKTLELARIEGGGPLAEQVIRVRGWLERTLAAIASAWGEKLELKVTVDEAVPAIQADAAAVQMILRNLVENSIKHGGVLPVRVGIAAHARDGEVVIEYQDNGRGAGDLKPLGRLFRRGASSAGTGIGLYLVRALMRRMGGHAEFANATGGGFRAVLGFRTSPDADEGG
jgi:signal transduction histidine kinase